MATYLRQALIGGLHRLGGVDYKEQITARHLLGHLAGLPDYFDGRPKDGKTLIEQVMAQDFAFTLEDMLDTVRHRLTPHFPPQPPDAPRPKVRYSDTNYQLLIAIIEAVTGQPIHAAIAAVLFEPLGLAHTRHAAAPPEAVTPATIWMDKQPLHIPLAMRSFGDLSSTTDDLLRLMRALIRGEVFDNPAAVNLMTERWRTFGFSLNPVRTSPGWPIQYGLGMMRFQIPRLFFPLRPTPPVIGHSGATGSWLFYCPALDVYVHQGAAVLLAMFGLCCGIWVPYSRRSRRLADIFCRPRPSRLGPAWISRSLAGASWLLGWAVNVGSGFLGGAALLFALMAEGGRVEFGMGFYSGLGLAIIALIFIPIALFGRALHLTAREVRRAY